MSESIESKKNLAAHLVHSLDTLPEVNKKTTKREMVALIASDIEKARRKGYSLLTIAEHLQQNGLDISYTVLRSLLPRQRQKSKSAVKSEKNPQEKKPLEIPQAKTTASLAVTKPEPIAPEPMTPQSAKTQEPSAADAPASSRKSAPQSIDRKNVVFPPGATYIPIGNGEFLPAPDSDDL